MKQYHKYRMHFDGKNSWLSGICMGISVFALAIQYLWVHDLTAVGMRELIFCLWLPMILCLGYIAMIRLIRYNAPGVFGILGSVLCLALAIGTFFYGGMAHIIFGCLGYAACAALLLLTSGGFLPGRIPAVLWIGVLIAARLLFFSEGVALLNQISDICILCGLLFLPLCMVDGNAAKEKKKSHS